MYRDKGGLNSAGDLVSKLFQAVGGEVRHNERASTYLAEAEFGYQSIRPYLLGLAPGSNVLEVGAGAGLLIRQCAEEFPELEFVGLEPMGDGFAFFDAFLKQHKDAPNAVIHRLGYEHYDSGQRYDFIYLVNVFEHLPDWPGFMAFVRDKLADNGRCLILCPNHTFPYEPHFRLPILFNKQVTGKVFGRRIRAFEQKHDCQGLWRSLNFVKLRQVVHCGSSLGLDVRNDASVFEEMVNRLAEDAEFQKRQGLWAWPVRVVKSTGALSILTRIGFFARRLPYMKLLVTLKS